MNPRMMDSVKGQTTGINAFDKTKAATLTSTVGDVATNLAKCDEMLDQIEQSLFGGGAPGISNGEPITLENYLDHCAQRSVTIAGRLESIASRIGQR